MQLDGGENEVCSLLKMENISETPWSRGLRRIHSEAQRSAVPRRNNPKTQQVD